MTTTNRAVKDAVSLIGHAVKFAAEHHTDQRRKGARAEPYFNHVADVAARLAEATAGSDPALVAAGYLHDTVEDTSATIAGIEAAFGADVADLVAAVTDDKGLTKAERKQQQIDKALTLSDRAKRLKIADKTSNLVSMSHSPPTDWPRDRIIDYAVWAEKVVDRCRGVDPLLEARFDEAISKLHRGLAQMRRKRDSRR